mgnify:CR=1 FL=1
MNCVFNAYQEHLHDLGLMVPRRDFRFYLNVKESVQPREHFTEGWLVPAIYHILGRWHDLDLRVEHRFLTPAHYKYEVRGQTFSSQGQVVAKASLIQAEWLGVEVAEFTLSPAVFLDLHIFHAYYGSAPVPGGFAVMALQFQKKG